MITILKHFESSVCDDTDMTWLFLEQYQLFQCENESIKNL